MRVSAIKRVLKVQRRPPRVFLCTYCERHCSLYKGIKYLVASERFQERKRRQKSGKSVRDSLWGIGGIAKVSRLAAQCHNSTGSTVCAMITRLQQVHFAARSVKHRARQHKSQHIYPLSHPLESRLEDDTLWSLSIFKVRSETNRHARYSFSCSYSIFVLYFRGTMEVISKVAYRDGKIY